MWAGLDRAGRERWAEPGGAGRMGWVFLYGLDMDWARAVWAGLLYGLDMGWARASRGWGRPYGLGSCVGWTGRGRLYGLGWSGAAQEEGRGATHAHDTHTHAVATTWGAC